MPATGTPYRRVKEKARYMLDFADIEQLYETIKLLIETAPTQTLDALCEVLDPDAQDAQTPDNSRASDALARDDGHRAW